MRNNPSYSNQIQLLFVFFAYPNIDKLKVAFVIVFTLFSTIINAQFISHTPDASFPNAPGQTYSAFEMPTENSQPIYCETNMSNTSWEQIATTFTPNDNYDMVWIRPYQAGLVAQEEAWLDVALPELIPNSNFSISSIYSPLPSCNINLSATNCPIRDASYEWIGPNGQTSSGQSISVDASVSGNLGVWTLTMQLPNAIATNSTCAQPFTSLSATINVVSCNCIRLPKLR